MPGCFSLEQGNSIKYRCVVEVLYHRMSHEKSARGKVSRIGQVVVQGSMTGNPEGYCLLLRPAHLLGAR